MGKVAGCRVQVAGCKLQVAGCKVYVSLSTLKASSEILFIFIW